MKQFEGLRKMDYSETPIDAAVIIGSGSDEEKIPVIDCYTRLNKLRVGFDVAVASCHRTPERVEKTTQILKKSKVRCIIAIGGMAFALAGIIAAKLNIPLVGVPLGSEAALLSITDLPPGVGAVTVGIDMGENAAIFTAKVVSVFGDRPSIIEELDELRVSNAAKVSKAHEAFQARLRGLQIIPEKSIFDELCD